MSTRNTMLIGQIVNNLIYQSKRIATLAARVKTQDELITALGALVEQHQEVLIELLAERNANYTLPTIQRKLGKPS